MRSRFSARDIFRQQENNEVPDNSDPISVPEGEDTQLGPQMDFPTGEIDQSDPFNDPEEVSYNFVGDESGGEDENTVIPPTQSATLAAGTFSLPGMRSFKPYRNQKPDTPPVRYGGTPDDVLMRRLRQGLLNR